MNEEVPRTGTLSRVLGRRMGAEGRRLFYGGQESLRRALLVRLSLVLFLFATAMAIFWFDREGLKDNFDNHLSFVDIVYFTFVTVTTVGYGDIVPTSPTARLMDALLVTPIRLFIWLIFLGTAYQLVVQRLVEEVRMRLRQARLRDHVILCGFGHSGRITAAELVRRKVPANQIVVIDQHAPALHDAANAGHVGLRGDATSEATLNEACVKLARAVILSLGRDDTTTLAVLTVRNLAPRVRVLASVREQENEKLVRQGGADGIILPAKVSGTLLAGLLEGSPVVDYVQDLISYDGPIALVRRTARPEEIGRALRDIADELVVRVDRGGRFHHFWEPGLKVQEGDTLIVVAPT
jgi:voltage-gated potassium channel